MIPKIIHYCWLSGDKYPDSIEKCITTWKEKLPDYEFILWDTAKFNLEDSLWVKQAFETKKYAFAADYIRLYAVYNYGGIYMDTDVEVVKSFNDLLELPYFIGTEGGGIVEAGVFGAEPKTQWVGDCLEYYKNREFIKPDTTLDIRTLPSIMMEQIGKTKVVTEMNTDEEITYSSDSPKLMMFPVDYFCAKNQGTGIVTVTKNTYTIHHFAMSWISKKTTFLPNIKRSLMKVFGVNTINKIIEILKLREIKKKLS